jgi:hypothetical protein
MTRSRPPSLGLCKQEVTGSIPVGSIGFLPEPQFVDTGVNPNTGPKSGGTSVTVTGVGFALGKTATAIRFGTTKSKSVNCTSSTECTAVAPAHEVGVVDVKATVNTLSSA